MEIYRKMGRKKNLRDKGAREGTKESQQSIVAEREIQLKTQARKRE